MTLWLVLPVVVMALAVAVTVGVLRRVGDELRAVEVLLATLDRVPQELEALRAETAAAGVPARVRANP